MSSYVTQSGRSICDIDEGAPCSVRCREFVSIRFAGWTC